MNTLLTISQITREALVVLENNLTFAKRVSRQYDERFGIEGAKIGTVLNVRKPPRYVGRIGQALAVESAVETQVPVTLDTQFGVDLQFSSSDLALSIDDFSDRFLKPAVATIANKIDYDGMQLYKQIYQSVGTPAAVPSALLTYLQAGVKLDDSACPIDGDRYMVISPLMQATIINALTTIFNPTKAISDQYRRGVMGEAVGFEWAMDQNVPSHTVGAYAAAGAVSGAGQTGSSVLTKSWTAADKLNRGDVFAMAGVYGVNPQSRQSTGSLQQFVATADFTADGSGNGTISISPSIITGGPFQNVTAAPANSAAITVVGTTGAAGRVGLAFHKDWATLACADLPLPGGVDMAARVSDKQLGISVRLVRAYNISTDQFPCRLDVLYGWSALRPELACRVAS